MVVIGSGSRTITDAELQSIIDNAITDYQSTHPSSGAPMSRLFVKNGISADFHYTFINSNNVDGVTSLVPVGGYFGINASDISADKHSIRLSGFPAGCSLVVSIVSPDGTFVSTVSPADAFNVFTYDLTAGLVDGKTTVLTVVPDFARLVTIVNRSNAVLHWNWNTRDNIAVVSGDIQPGSSNNWYLVDLPTAFLLQVIVDGGSTDYTLVEYSHSIMSLPGAATPISDFFSFTLDSLNADQSALLIVDNA